MNVNTKTKDFFISYNRFDKDWAEWIASTLCDAGYDLVLQAWDFIPGDNFVLKMQEASQGCDRTIAILSETYLNSAFTAPEWAAAFAQDPSSKDRKLIPIKVKPCKPEGLLGPIVSIDLVGIPKDEAEQRLLNGLKPRGRGDRTAPFPG